MASLSRKFLTSIGIDDEKADLIIEKHSEVVTEIKDERDKYKAEADKLPDIQKQLEGYKEAEKNSDKDPYKVKYEALKEEMADYKASIEKEKTAAKKEGAFRALLKDAGIPEKRFDAIIKVSDVDAIEFDDDGKVSNADALADNIKKEWADFIPVKHSEGANTATPPQNNGKTTKTKAEIRAISDPIERQKAMMENAGLFGLPEANN